MSAFDAPTAPKKVYVLDCGGQYAHLIASRVRAHSALSVIVPCEISAADIAGDVGAIIVSGGPQSVFDPSSLRVDPAIWKLPVPILGICYGCQLMCRDLGGEVEQATTGEYGPAKISVPAGAAGVVPLDADGTVVWMSHRDRVVKLPPGFSTTASTADCPHAAVECSEGGRRLYGLQLHPEVTHTVKGRDMLGNFVAIAGLAGTWRVDDFVEAQMQTIRDKTAGGRSVFVLVSGGVDSTVVYALLAKVLPADRVLGLYVDTGMMRKGESEFVEAELLKAGLPNLKCVDASQQFLSALEGVTAPEAKRRIIGQQFLEVQRAQCALLGLDPESWLLGQGTIYPDTIESGGKAGKAAVIKTHHNRVPEIEALIERGLVIEPLAELYKDEVRAVGEQLGLAKHLVWRQPFPGPGLGVRLLCTDAAAESAADRAARRAAVEAARRLVPFAGCAIDVPPLRSVGCQGDSRTYRNFVVLRNYVKDWDQLGDVATKIVNECDAVNRVLVSLCNSPVPEPYVFDVAPGGPHTVTRGRLDMLREADAIVTRHLEANNVDVWQCPVVMGPLSLTGAVGDEVIIMRPVDSTEAMTASFARVPWAVCASIAHDIRAKLPGVVDVFYDITNKPPGTIEFE
ncbi:hypothetical protein M885DRAFT_625214 [Pelagophyceae sp. CCMP2097]|nr:hypothetical protein M885DRAFT_625214 [Pelagophyceae sp. CCMP2097]